jgi:hypothetical protein
MRSNNFMGSDIDEVLITSLVRDMINVKREGTIEETADGRKRVNIKIENTEESEPDTLNYGDQVLIRLSGRLFKVEIKEDPVEVTEKL